MCSADVLPAFATSLASVVEAVIVTAAAAAAAVVVVALVRP